GHGASHLHPRNLAHTRAPRHPLGASRRPRRRWIETAHWRSCPGQGAAREIEAPPRERRRRGGRLHRRRGAASRCRPDSRRNQGARRSRRQFRFRGGACLPVGHRRAPLSQPGRQMMTASDRKLVLIVDDTPTNVAVVSGVLKDSFRTKVATNGEKALAIANAPDKPDLILLDVMMPGMDGFEVCRRLKDNPATRDIPIIFLTAKTDEVDEEKGFDVGAVDYIHKPFSAPIVLARVRTQLALQEALIEAKEARNQADQLLHALLPKKAADEIRSIGTVIPRRYENVAVLFCDVTNFTAYCDKHEPEDVVSRLDALFVIFERIAAKHGLEKIKTIGDGFMAAAGLLHKVNDP